MAHDPLRRINIEKMTPAEVTIHEAMGDVEKAGAHPHLTKAINLLTEAKEAVADFVDGIEFKEGAM